MVLKIIKQLSSETKIVLLYFIINGTKTSVCDLADVAIRGTKNVSKQLNELKGAGILQVKTNGKERIYSLANDLDSDSMKLILLVIEQYSASENKCKCIDLSSLSTKDKCD